MHSVQPSWDSAPPKRTLKYGVWPSKHPSLIRNHIAQQLPLHTCDTLFTDMIAMVSVLVMPCHDDEIYCITTIFIFHIPIMTRILEVLRPFRNCPTNQKNPNS